MDYTSLVPMSPPRAEKAVPPSAISTYENMGWYAQYKKNGTYNVAYVAPDKGVTFMNRHMEEHKAWKPTEREAAPYRDLPGKGWYVVCSELVHSKVPGIRDVQYVHDVIVADGEWLLGETYAQRYARLMSLFLRDREGETKSHWVLKNGVWLAKNLKSGFARAFREIDDPEDEGLVFKDPRAPLVPGAGRWSMKTRYPHKNFTY